MSTKPHSIKYWIGFLFTEAGNSLSKVGSFLQGSVAYKENLNRTRRIMYFEKYKPDVTKDVFVAPSAQIIGNVQIGKSSSVWYQTVLRGDVNKIQIGEMSNLQDRVVVHGSSVLGEEAPVIIGNRVTVEAGAILHACKLDDESYIGIGANILDGSVVGSQAMVAPGSVVVPGTIVQPGELWAGSPAKFLRTLSSAEREAISKHATRQFELSKIHKEECGKEMERLEKEIQETIYRDDKLGQYTYEGSEPVDLDNYPNKQ
jgi:carbonic anhydrase/acetyltransferase-like protein (isoleucine patch superfamily)